MRALIKSKLDELNKICLNRSVAKLYTFGSVNSSSFSTNSDVDMLVEFKEIDVLEYADNYIDMCYDLELILDRKVDLLTIQSVKNPIFKKEIESTRVLIYAA